MDEPRALAPETEHWTARFSRPIIFVIVTLIGMGVYLAFNIPIAVFPSTDFPRIALGVDNGVAPIDQMQVTVTRPIEEAMNSVPGLEIVRSTTSRGSADIGLFFNWNVDMFQTLQYVNAALAKAQPNPVCECRAREGAAESAAYRKGHGEPFDIRRVSDPRLQPDIRHAAANQALGTGKLHHQAAPQPGPRCFYGNSPGRPNSRVSN
jgi:hypothetical protein